jgi:hypothetical protein
MPRIRSDYPLPRDIAVEILALVLVEHFPQIRIGHARYEAQRCATVILDALGRRKVGMLMYPSVVGLDGGVPPAEASARSSKALRSAARFAWDACYQRRPDPSEAFQAALKTTMEMQPAWTLEDAALHTIKFVVPARFRRG